MDDRQSFVLVFWHWLSVNGIGKNEGLQCKAFLGACRSPHIATAMRCAARCIQCFEGTRFRRTRKWEKFKLFPIWKLINYQSVNYIFTLSLLYIVYEESIVFVRIWIFCENICFEGPWFKKMVFGVMFACVSVCL